MSWIQFESGREKEAARDALRESRNKILERAEAEYHKKQMRAEQAKLRGDDKWILPAVESKITSDKKSPKKRKKNKKEKSKKKKKRSTKSSSSSDGSDQEEWVEKIVPQPEKTVPISTSTEFETKVQPTIRDEWMNLPGLFPCISHRDEKQIKTQERADKKDRGTIDQLGRSERELNPYWKNGGTGLPETEEGSSNNSSNTTMDVKWLKKSLQRAREQAVEEGRSLEEIAAERWGSLARLQSLIDEAQHKSLNPRQSRMKHDEARDKDTRYHKSSEDRNFTRGGNKSNSKDRRELSKHDVSERNNRNPRSRSKEQHRSETPDDSMSSRNSRRLDDRRRERSNSREYVHHNESAHRSHKLGFKRPAQDDYLSIPSGSKSSSYSGSKNWKKPEASKKNVMKELPQSRSRASSESENNSDVEPDKREAEEVIMTEAEMNQLGAKIVKCEIMGDNVLATELKAKLEKAREARKNAPVKPAMDLEETAVILTKTDARGITRPVEPRSQHEESHSGRKKKTKIDTHEGGQRVRYFADDDKYSIKDMFQQEKGRSTNEDDAMFTKIASKSMDMDEMFEDKVRFKERDAKQDERERLQAIKQHEKMSKSLDSCKWCIDSKKMLKHMIVAMGSKVYMSLPPWGSLTTGHCILAPIHHVICQTQLDEDVWEELQTFRKALTNMFTTEEQDVIFFETSMGHRKFPHMQLECIPMPREIGDMAPIYFKKALLECETEWSTNKKIVDLSTKSLRRSIPKGLPYFAVDFGMQGGFAHVIEDENMFPKNFAQEIIGGMLDLDRNSWRKPKQENFDQQRSKVIEFAKMWKKYDFTISDDSD